MMISFGVQAMKTMINLVSVIAAKLEKMHRPCRTINAMNLGID
jgi:hypothetical protein